MKKHRTAGLRAILWVGSFFIVNILCADEWIDTDGDGETDTLQLDPFYANSNDPATFDWEGFINYLAQTIWATDASLTAAASSGGSGGFGDGGSGTTQHINYANGAALNPFLPMTVLARVEVDSNGSRIRVDTNKLWDAVKNDDLLRKIAVEGVKSHENQHISDALQRNPNIFSNVPSGEVYVLAFNNEALVETEYRGYSAEANYLQNVLTVGSFEGVQISSQQRNHLTSWLSNRNQAVNSYRSMYVNMGGTP